MARIVSAESCDLPLVRFRGAVRGRLGSISAVTVAIACNRSVRRATNGAALDSPQSTALRILRENDRRPMATVTTTRAACAARSLAAAHTERRWAATSRERAERQEAAMTGAGGALHPQFSGSVAFHRTEQSRHEAVAGLQQAYGDCLLDAAEAGPALVLAIGTLVGEADLALHLVASSGLTVSSGASFGTATSCRDLESLLGEGPGAGAVASGAIVMEQTEVSIRWPVFMRAALDLGVRSVTAVPLGPAGITVGAVTIYSSDPLHVADATTRLIPVLSDALLRLLLDDEEAGTDHALGSGGFAARVHQATAMIAARHGRNTDDALALLRARAYADDVPLRELAEQIVTGLADID
jgi:hypothetical protein